MYVPKVVSAQHGRWNEMCHDKPGKGKPRQTRSKRRKARRVAGNDLQVGCHRLWWWQIAKPWSCTTPWDMPHFRPSFWLLDHTTMKLGFGRLGVEFAIGQSLARANQAWGLLIHVHRALYRYGIKTASESSRNFSWVSSLSRFHLHYCSPLIQILSANVFSEMPG